MTNLLYYRLAKCCALLRRHIVPNYVAYTGRIELRGLGRDKQKRRHVGVDSAKTEAYAKSMIILFPTSDSEATVTILACFVCGKSQPHYLPGGEWSPDVQKNCLGDYSRSAV